MLKESKNVCVPLESFLACRIFPHGLKIAISIPVIAAKSQVRKDIKGER